MLKILHFSSLNLLRNKKNFIKIVFSFSFSFIFVFCAFFYSVTINRKINRIYDSYASANQYTLQVKNKQGISHYKNIEYIRNYLENSEYIASYSQITTIPTYVDYEIDENWILNTYEGKGYIEHTKLIVDGVEYIGENDYSYNFDNFNSVLPNSEQTRVILDVSSINCGDFMLESEKIEFKEKFPQEQAVYGKSILEKGEVLISDYLLKKYGCDYSSILNKKINFYISNDDGEGWIPFLSELTVVGVISENFYRINSRHNFSHVVLSYEEEYLYYWEQYYRNNGDKERARWIAYHLNSKVNTNFIFDATNYDDFVQLQTILNEEFGSEYVKVNDKSIEAYISLSKEQKFFSFIFNILAFIISIVILTNTFNILNNIFHKKYKFIYMLKSIGFRNIHIYLINFFETLIYIIIGSVIGVAASAIFISLIGSFLKDMLLIAISFLDYLLCFGITFTILGFLYLIVMSILSFRFFKKNISENLK